MKIIKGENITSYELYDEPYRHADGYSKKVKALDNSLDTRKFEISLYWHRAAYFWAFIALMFTAYYQVVEAARMSDDLKHMLSCVISGLGIFISLCWLFVNKASKYWQENWEHHVCFLEDDIIGPLYKRTYCSKNGIKSILNPIQSCDFSVSKINQILSSAIVIAWMIIFWKSLCIFCNYCVLSAIMTLILVAIYMWILCHFCRTKGSMGKKCNMKTIKIIT
jgi:hypothetical protein